MQNFAMLDYHHSLKELRETIEFFSDNAVILRKAEETPFRIAKFAMVRRNYIFPQISYILGCFSESGIYGKWKETYFAKWHHFVANKIQHVRPEASYAKFFMKKLTNAGGNEVNWQEAKSVSWEFLRAFFAFIGVLIGMELAIFCGEINLPAKMWRLWDTLRSKIKAYMQGMRKRKLLRKWATNKKNG